MSEQAKATARKFFEAQDSLRGGPDDALCADGYTARLAGYPPMDLHGHQGFSAGFYAAFPDLEHRVEELIAEGDRVAVRFRLMGTNTGEFMGNPPTGKGVDIGALALLTVVDGQVSEIDADFDQLGLMQQLGAE